MSGMNFDDIGFGKLVVVQGDDFKYGIDAVLLSAFASGETGARGIIKNSVQPGKYIAKSVNVADLGTGNGIIPFILSHKLRKSDIRITGIEKNEAPYKRAVKGLEKNMLHGKIKFINADVLDINDKLNDNRLEYEIQRKSYDAVISNPPYFKKGAAIPNANKVKFEARHETSAVFGDFAVCASELLKNNGDLYIIHRPSRLADVFEALRNVRIEPKELQLVVPRRGFPANLILIHAIKGANPELKMLPDISVYKDNGSEYSSLINQIYER